jgi:hydrogenase maturation protease
VTDRRRIVVIGVGNVLRGDDGAGLAVAAQIRAHAPEGVSVRVCEEEPTRLIDAFADADVAFVVDAVSTGAPAGTVHRFDASEAPVPSRELRSSTHALGVGEALELARALDRLPRQTVVFGVEGRDFVAREGMSPAVVEGVGRASATVLQEVAACMSEP